MEIKIGDNYKITSDKLNVTVNERYEKLNEGQPSGVYDFKQVAYFGKLDQAINFVLSRQIKASDSESLQELKAQISNVEKEIKKALDIEQKKVIQELRKELAEKNSVINGVKNLVIRHRKDAIDAHDIQLILDGEGLLTKDEECDRNE